MVTIKRAPAQAMPLLDTMVFSAQNRKPVHVTPSKGQPLHAPWGPLPVGLFLHLNALPATPKD